jgi:hypothetical protein
MDHNLELLIVLYPSEDQNSPMVQEKLNQDDLGESRRLPILDDILSYYAARCIGGLYYVRWTMGEVDYMNLIAQCNHGEVFQ